MRAATPAPWPLGTRIRYPGPEYSSNDGPWVRIGDVGVVVEIMDPLEGNGDIEPFDGSSVVEFHGDARCRRAVSQGSVERQCVSCYDHDLDSPEESVPCDGPHDRYEVVTA